MRSAIERREGYALAQSPAHQRASSLCAAAWRWSSVSVSVVRVAKGHQCALARTSAWTDSRVPAASETINGGLFDATGTVQFRAMYIQQGQRGVLAETSRFVRQDRHWTYLGPID